MATPGGGPGFLPNDLDLLGQVVEDISFNNGRDYFPMRNATERPHLKLHSDPGGSLKRSLGMVLPFHLYREPDSGYT
jgi:hypothetical protein